MKQNRLVSSEVRRQLNQLAPGGHGATCLLDGVHYRKHGDRWQLDTRADRFFRWLRMCLRWRLFSAESANRILRSGAKSGELPKPRSAGTWSMNPEP